MEKPPIRLGIIGTGLFSQAAHIATFTQTPGCEVVALADKRNELLHTVADKYNVVGRYGHHKAMLKAESLDAVVVCTDRASLDRVSFDCILARKHVLTEKPMAQSSEMARAMVSCARMMGVRYIAGMMKRHSASLQSYHQLVQMSGKIQSMRVWCRQGDFRLPAGITTDEPRPVTPEEPFARFINVFIHDLNLVRMFAGNQVTAIGGVIDRSTLCGAVVLDTPAFPVTLECGKVDGPWDEGIEIVFDHGSPARLAIPSPFETGCYHRQAQAFVASVRGGSPNPCEGANCVGDLVLAEGIWKVA